MGVDGWALGDRVVAAPGRPRDMTGAMPGTVVAINRRLGLVEVRFDDERGDGAVGWWWCDPANVVRVTAEEDGEP